eukprot:gene12527-26391_t
MIDSESSPATPDLTISLQTCQLEQAFKHRTRNHKLPDYSSNNNGINVLQPRSHVCVDSKEGWIPLLRSISMLNIVLDCINIHIAHQRQGLGPSSSSSSSMETFTKEELAGLIRGKGDVPETLLRAVALGLVHLERLDFGHENGIK